MTLDMLSRAFGLKTLNDEERTVDFIASTDALDSYEEVVEQDWNLKRFKKNPVVLFGHQSRDLPVGSCTRCEVVKAGDKMQLECTVKFADAAANPMAEQVWQSVKQGTLRAVSVGFTPGDVRFEKRDGKGVYVLSKNELHEISVVPIPANPEALAKMRSKARAAATDEGSTGPSAQEKADMDLTEALAKISELKTSGAELALKVNEETARAEKAEKALADITAWREQHEQVAFDERIARAVEDYGLAESDKELLGVILKAKPEAFERKYAKKDRATSHLTKSFTEGREASALTVHSGGKSESITQATKRLMKEKRLSYAAAQNEAMSLSRAAR